MSQDSTYPGIRRALRLSYSDAEVPFVFCYLDHLRSYPYLQDPKGALYAGAGHIYVGKVGTLT